MLDIEEIKSKIQDFDSRNDEIKDIEKDIEEANTVLRNDRREFETEFADIIAGASTNPIRNEQKNREEAELKSREDELLEIRGEITNQRAQLTTEFNDFRLELLKNVQREKDKLNEQFERFRNSENAEQFGMTQGERVERLESLRKEKEHIESIIKERDQLVTDSAIYRNRIDEWENNNIDPNDAIYKRLKEEVLPRTDSRISEIDQELEKVKGRDIDKEIADESEILEFNPETYSAQYDSLEKYENKIKDINVYSMDSQLESLRNLFEVKSQEELRQEAEEEARKESEAERASQEEQQGNRQEQESQEEQQGDRQEQIIQEEQQEQGEQKETSTEGNSSLSTEDTQSEQIAEHEENQGDRQEQESQEGTQGQEAGSASKKHTFRHEAISKAREEAKTVYPKAIGYIISVLRDTNNENNIIQPSKLKESLGLSSALVAIKLMDELEKNGIINNKIVIITEEEAINKLKELGREDLIPNENEESAEVEHTTQDTPTQIDDNSQTGEETDINKIQEQLERQGTIESLIPEALKKIAVCLENNKKVFNVDKEFEGANLDQSIRQGLFEKLVQLGVIDELEFINEETARKLIEQYGIENEGQDNSSASKKHTAEYEMILKAREEAIKTYPYAIRYIISILRDENNENNIIEPTKLRHDLGLTYGLATMKLLDLLRKREIINDKKAIIITEEEAINKLKELGREDLLEDIADAGQRSEENGSQRTGDTHAEQMTGHEGHQEDGPEQETQGDGQEQESQEDGQEQESQGDGQEQETQEDGQEQESQGDGQEQETQGDGQEQETQEEQEEESEYEKILSKKIEANNKREFKIDIGKKVTLNINGKQIQISQRRYKQAAQLNALRTRCENNKENDLFKFDDYIRSVYSLKVSADVFSLIGTCIDQRVPIDFIVLSAIVYADNKEISNNKKEYLLKEYLLTNMKTESISKQKDGNRSYIYLEEALDSYRDFKLKNDLMVTYKMNEMSETRVRSIIPFFNELNKEEKEEIARLGNIAQRKEIGMTVGKYEPTQNTTKNNSIFAKIKSYFSKKFLLPEPKKMQTPDYTSGKKLKESLVNDDDFEAAKIYHSFRNRIQHQQEPDIKGYAKLFPENQKVLDKEAGKLAKEQEKAGNQQLSDSLDVLSHYSREKSDDNEER